MTSAKRYVSGKFENLGTSRIKKARTFSGASLGATFAGGDLQNRLDTLLSASDAGEHFVRHIERKEKF